MKRLIVVLMVIIGIGAIIMTSCQNINRLNYTKYSPKDQLIDLTFEYPKGWLSFERRGSFGSFIQAQILEDLSAEEKDKRRACSIVITIYPKAQAKFAPLTTQGLAEDTKNKRLALKGSRLVASSNTTVAGLAATDDTLTYELFVDPWKANAKPVSVNERIVCFQKGDNFYAVRMVIGVDSFQPYNKIFDRILESIQFSS